MIYQSQITKQSITLEGTKLGQTKWWKNLKGTKLGELSNESILKEQRLDKPKILKVQKGNMWWFPNISWTKETLLKREM